MHCFAMNPFTVCMTRIPVYTDAISRHLGLDSPDSKTKDHDKKKSNSKKKSESNKDKEKSSKKKKSKHSTKSSKESSSSKVRARILVLVLMHVCDHSTPMLFTMHVSVTSAHKAPVYMACFSGRD